MTPRRRTATDARDRRAAWTGPRPARRAIGGWATATILVASVAWGCGTQPAPSPTPAPSASPAAATPSPTATPAPAYADTLRIGFVTGADADVSPLGAPSGFRQATGGVSLSQVMLWNVVQGSLYRYDARFDVVPDLADGPCQPRGDGTVIRCRFVETTFHDGTPLTADDVAYSYGIFQRETFPVPGLTGRLVEVQIVDERTVDFVLSARDPTFLTMALPGIPILPRHAVEASYAAFAAGTKDLTAKDLTKLADTIDEGLGRATPVCSPRVEDAAALLAKIGVRLYREDFTNANGTFDACTYLGIASGFIGQAAVALDATGLDAVAVAWQLLSIDWRPIGTGPYRLVSEDADGIHLEAWPGYHGGLAATRFLDFVPTNPDGSGLENGTVDIFQRAFLGSAYEAAAASHGVRVATLPDVGFYALAFNVRPGRLFADVNLRKALQLCVDLPRDVDASTGGTGTSVYGPVLPGSWADDPTLPKPPRDTGAAKRLIEGAGWQLDPDGIYAKDGVRLAAKIVVRVQRPDRIKMADLIALQARDCGMDLASLPKADLGEMWTYPHDIPGTHAPFDLLIAWTSAQVDPADALGYFASSNITDAKHPNGGNFIGFSDPVLDRLIEAATSTYNQAERTSLYRQAQEEIAAQQPNLFLWAANRYDAVRSAVATADGPLDLTVLNWAWQPERLVVAASGP